VITANVVCVILLFKELIATVVFALQQILIYYFGGFLHGFQVLSLPDIVVGIILHSVAGDERRKM
jgi:dTDP-4-dehydrorhamnose 3,5-epimerase-like enzyme